MSQSSQSVPQSESDPLELAADQAIAACDGDVRAALKATIVAYGCLESDVKELQAAVSSGYARCKGIELPANRKDWYD